jgi:vitamin B12 transporter
MRSILASVFLFLSFSISSFAQSPASASAEIVVTASSVPESIESTPASVTIVTKSDIEKREARDVSDVLREVPGLNVSRTGSPGKTTSLFIRGGSSKEALVLWNGVAMNNAYLSAYDFLQLSTAGVEKVEIIRGPYSALYGSDAVSGVVNVLTTPVRSDLTVEAEAGQDGLRNGLVGGAYVSGIWTVHGAAERRVDHGFTANDDFTSNTFVAGVQAAPASNLSIGLLARRSTYDLGIPRNANSDFTAFVPTPHRREDGSETQALIPLHLEASGFRYEVRLADNERIEKFRDPDAPFGGEFANTHSSTRSARASVQAPSTSAGLITLGGELERSNVDHTDSYGLDVRHQSRNSRSLFVEDRLSVPVAATKLEIAAGARYDHFDTFGTQISPRLGLAFIENSRKWRAAYGAGFRAPAIGELYSPFFGNPKLHAEHSRNVEVGFDQYLRGAMLSVTAFRSTYRDLISYDVIANKFGNVDRAKAHGVELAAARRFGPLDASISYTWLKAVDASTNEQLVRRPKNSGSIALGYDFRSISAELIVTHAGARRDITDLVPFGVVINEGHTTADVTVKYRTRGVAPFVKIENATDAKYDEVFGYPSARRRFIAGIRYSAQ